MPEMIAPILLYGYGNPSRGDDGLGPALVAALEKHPLEGVALDANFQLSLEDAQTITEYGTVIFADASTTCQGPFTFEKIDENGNTVVGWTSHSMKPRQLVALANNLFQRRIEAYELAIRGYEFGDFCEELSCEAKANLSQTLDFIRGMVSKRHATRPASVSPNRTAGTTSGSMNRKAQP